MLQPVLTTFHLVYIFPFQKITNISSNIILSIFEHFKHFQETEKLKKHQKSIKINKNTNIKGKLAAFVKDIWKSIERPLKQ